MADDVKQPKPDDSVKIPDVVIPKQTEPPRSWSQRLASNMKQQVTNGKGQRLQSWGALLLGVAALVTAFGTYRDPAIDDKKFKAAYDELRGEVIEMSKDVESLSNDVNYLYRLREEEARTKKLQQELTRSQQELEDMFLKRELAARHGEKYAAEFMKRKKQIREEIESEEDALQDRPISKPQADPPNRRVPLPYDVVKDSVMNK